MIDLETFETRARRIGQEHRDAITKSEETATKLAKLDAEYHGALAGAIPAESAIVGKTLAEASAKGQEPVKKIKEERDIAAAEDRAAMERIRLSRDDRSSLQMIAAWSRANEQVE